MKSDGKDPTVGRTNDLSAKSLFQYRNGLVWVTTRPRFDGDEDYKTRDKFAAFLQMKASSANETTFKSC